MGPEHRSLPRGRSVPAVIDARALLDRVHQQLEREGWLSVPMLAQLLEAPEADVVDALTDLYRRGWFDRCPQPPYFRITPAGDAVRRA